DVILASGLDVGGRLYQAEVDRSAVRLERVGLDQPVVAIAIAQIGLVPPGRQVGDVAVPVEQVRSEEHTSELQSRENLVCRLLLGAATAALLALSLHDALPI